MILMLYYAPGASSLAAHIALEEAAAPFDATRVMLSSGEQRSDVYRAINPRARIPALRTDDGVLTENIALLSYIANRFPAAELLPRNDPWLLGKAYEQMSWMASTVHVAIAQIWRTERFTEDEQASAMLKQDGRLHVQRFYGEIETVMGQEWLLGERYSVLDPYALVFWRWGERLGMEMAAFRNWAGHTKRMLERPAVIRVLERENAPDAPFTLGL